MWSKIQNRSDFLGSQQIGIFGSPKQSGFGVNGMGRGKGKREGETVSVVLHSSLVLNVALKDSN